VAATPGKSDLRTEAAILPEAGESTSLPPTLSYTRRANNGDETHCAARPFKHEKARKALPGTKIRQKPKNETKVQKNFKINTKRPAGQPLSR
jgi:hypothetical protein